MRPEAPKRFEELPAARILDIPTGEKDPVVLKLQFQSRVGVGIGECCLLWKTTQVLEGISGDLSMLSETGEAEFVSSAEDVTDWGSGEVRYLCKPWAPYHVWMISLSTWHFEKREFKASDAIAERCPEDAPPSLVGGEPVLFWLRVTSPTSPNKERLYPNDDRPEGLLQGAWDHEHCEFCNEQIVAGKVAYVDLGDHWICEECHAQLVRTVRDA